MSSGIDMVSVTGSVASPGAPASAATASSTEAAASVAAQRGVTLNSTSTEAVSVHSPRVIPDPAAGFITQYLSNNGDVISQTPSAVTVAYLRGGLSADGLPKAAGASVTA